VADHHRDHELIVLVDERGRGIGSAEKGSSHHADTPLHLAFSCYVFDGWGRLLVTRRSEEKQVWPGVWSNTACGHPAPGEEIAAAVERRLHFELGMTAVDLRVVLPDYLYRAPPFRGIVEHEFCPVVFARAGSPPRPNPAEVQSCSWVRWHDFVRAAAEDTGDGYSWWCKDQLNALRGHPLVEVYSRAATSDGGPPTRRHSPPGHGPPVVPLTGGAGADVDGGTEDGAS
jgi:isopentenyl-diphosphate delta-isomerase